LHFADKLKQDTTKPCSHFFSIRFYGNKRCEVMSMTYYVLIRLQGAAIKNDPTPKM